MISVGGLNFWTRNALSLLLRDEREAKRLSRHELAKAAGVDTSIIESAERGDEDADRIRRLRRIVRGL